MMVLKRYRIVGVYRILNSVRYPAVFQKKMSGPVQYPAGQNLSKCISQMKVTFEPSCLDNSQKFPGEFHFEEKIDNFFNYF